MVLTEPDDTTDDNLSYYKELHIGITEDILPQDGSLLPDSYNLVCTIYGSEKYNSSVSTWGTLGSYKTYSWITAHLFNFTPSLKILLDHR